MIKKLHIQILYFFWPIYLIIFLLIPLKLILSIIGLLGTIATIILIKKNKNDEFSTLKKNLHSTGPFYRRSLCIQKISKKIDF